MNAALRWRAALGLLLVAGLIGCSGSSGSGGSGPDGTGPGDWVAGDYPPQLMRQEYLSIAGLPGQGGVVREYKLRVPSGYDPAVPSPLVFCFHGLVQNPVLFCARGAAMHEKAEAENFILVMPKGQDRSWNGGACCAPASEAQLDDVGFVRAVFAEISGHLNIDRRRVYALGLSNGAFLSYRLACEASDIFTAIVSGAGAIMSNELQPGATSDFETCRPQRPVSVLHLHGTRDNLVDYADQKPALDHIAQANGCSLQTTPAAQPASGGDTSCVSYTGCPEGVVVTGCTVEGGGHCWFGNASCGTGVIGIGNLAVGANSDTLHNTDAAWEFLAPLHR